eukprot:CAMPEP_0202860870 /NCGR_PEP_ID=MMETSP1391-20130828/2448_1 /ASSEMBLY_ACC=CAM_ASM_000867 /TAXON_ID=1034604 /ORGANISM="Chlamydomonas leiostraca, Strain SAG 11-49" /LENGTH=115 /DNA_ID=CAMNT_0049540145 /DNA_START=1143 /DNA_END=1490 /DNA_ORIENTATION=+
MLIKAAFQSSVEDRAGHSQGQQLIYTGSVCVRQCATVAQDGLGCDGMSAQGCAHSMQQTHLSVLLLMVDVSGFSGCAYFACVRVVCWCTVDSVQFAVAESWACSGISDGIWRVAQ